MGELGPLLEDVRDRMTPDAGALERVVAFRQRQHNRQRLVAGTLALAIAAVTFVVFANAFRGQVRIKPGISPIPSSSGLPSPSPLSRYLPPSFLEPRGWHVTQSALVKRGEASWAWASTIAFDAADLAPLAPVIPVRTIETLPTEGIIVTAEITPWGFDPANGPYPAAALKPLDLSTATMRGRQGEEPPGNYSVLQIDNPYVLIRVYVNATNPSPALIARAQTELDTLRVPPVCPVPQSGPYRVTPSSSNGAPGATITISGPMPFQREDGSFDQSGATKMIAWWNASPADWSSLSSLSTALPSPAGPGPLLRLGQGGIGSCSFSIPFVVPNVPAGDYSIDVLQESADGSTLEASIIFQVSGG